MSAAHLVPLPVTARYVQAGWNGRLTHRLWGLYLRHEGGEDTLLARFRCGGSTTKPGIRWVSLTEADTPCRRCMPTRGGDDG